MTDPILVSVKKAAELVGLSPGSMYTLCDQQVVDSVYQGRRRLVVYKSLQSYAQSLPRHPQEAAS